MLTALHEARAAYDAEVFDSEWCRQGLASGGEGLLLQRSLVWLKPFWLKKLKLKLRMRA